jgi:ubiquitin C-terminal hydrolase
MTSLEESDCEYSLVAVICHNGNLNCGHYYALGKVSGNAWYCYNDSIVEPITSPVQSNAYILLYERKTA